MSLFSRLVEWATPTRETLAPPAVDGAATEQRDELAARRADRNRLAEAWQRSIESRVHAVESQVADLAVEVDLLQDAEDKRQRRAGP